MNQKRDLSSIYRRIKKNCCVEWQQDARVFYEWYDAQLKRQNQSCKYCGLPGDTRAYYQKWFREGRRGRSLEVDRLDSGKPYSPENCVLACYPCNNAKSDVFSYDEFLEIGKAIRMAKTRLDKLTWHEGVVDTAKEYIRITYGERNTPVCLVQPQDKIFVVQFTLSERQITKSMIDGVKKELDFYLVQKGEPNPWAYAKYHCSTAANMHSKVHWILECPY